MLPPGVAPRAPTLAWLLLAVGAACGDTSRPRAARLDDGGDAGAGGGGGAPRCTFFSPPKATDPSTCDEAATLGSYVGCEYWPTVTANPVWEEFDFAVVVANNGGAPATVTVDGGGLAPRAFEIPPGQLVPIYLPWVSALKGASADTCGRSPPMSASVVAKAGAYHLVSDRPITVVQYSALEYRGQGGPEGKDWSTCRGHQVCAGVGKAVGCFSFSNDASLLLPTSALGKSYRVAAPPSSKEGSMSSFVALTATADGTQVTVKLGAATAVRAGGAIAATGPGGVVSLTLDRGDVAELVGGDGAEWSGSTVVASAPVQAIVGTPCAQVPEGTMACDHLEESLFPAEAWGRRYFVTTPTGPKGKGTGHFLRLHGAFDGTLLTYRPSKPAGAPDTLDAGQVVDVDGWERPTSLVFEVEGTAPFAVSAYLPGAALLDPSSPTGSERGDPSLTFVVPVEQYRERYVFLAPNDYDLSYLDVVVPEGAALSLDGAPVTATRTYVGDGCYATVRLPLEKTGAHELVSTLPVGAQLVGYGAYTSYQVPAGVNLLPIAPAVEPD